MCEEKYWSSHLNKKLLHSKTTKVTKTDILIEGMGDLDDYTELGQTVTELEYAWLLAK
jgi:hypothetical protein